MSHNIRTSVAKKVELVNHMIDLKQEMHTHLTTCEICDDDIGICYIGNEIMVRMSIANRTLERVGIFNE